MKRKLREEDRQAIDLLLDRTPRVDANGATIPPPVLQAPTGIQPSVRAVGSLLNLLNHLPSEAPPTDLVQRTMQYIRKQESLSDDFAPRESLSDSGMFTL